jgi:hypothetical protein
MIEITFRLTKFIICPLLIPTGGCASSRCIRNLTSENAHVAVAISVRQPLTTREPFN